MDKKTETTEKKDWKIMVICCAAAIATLLFVMGPPCAEIIKQTYNLVSTGALQDKIDTFSLNTNNLHEE